MDCCVHMPFLWKHGDSLMLGKICEKVGPMKGLQHFDNKLH